MPDSRSVGLYEKYRVDRVDGHPIGRCIVLELADPNSWNALLEWADSVAIDGYEILAEDVRASVSHEMGKGAAETGDTDA